MKKLILGLLVSLLTFTLVYAKTDTDLWQKEIAATVKSEMENKISNIELETAPDEESGEAKDPDKILQEYINLCDGNEKLGKILYDKRQGKTIKANALGKYIVERNYFDWGPTYDIAFVRWAPFQETRSIHNYYPDGIYVIKNNKVEYIPGPLAGILTAHVYTRELVGEFLATYDKIVIEFTYSVYRDDGSRVFINKTTSPVHIKVDSIMGYERDHFEIKVRPYLIDFKGNMFDNEEDAQKTLNKQLAKKERKERRAERKEKLNKQKEEIKQTMDEKWEEWFH